MFVQPYLNFNGRCDEALDFYKKAVGAKVEMLIRFKESPEPTNIPPGSENKVMHSTFKIGESILNATDGHCTETDRFSGFMLSLSVADEAEAQRVFTALADAGKITMPLAKTFFSKSFGMLADRFGVNWMVLVKPA